MGKKSDHTGHSVHRYMNGLVDDLCELIGKALKKADTDAIHDARVTTRRLTAAIRLLDEVVSAEYRKPFNKALKSLRRCLGPLRDLDVMIEHLAEFAKQDRHTAAVEWLAQSLEDQRQKLRDEAAEESPNRTLAKLGTWLPLGAEIRSAEHDLPAILARAIHRQLNLFTLEADRLGNPPGDDVPGPVQDPHELRITAKLLRYSLELASVAGTDFPPNCMKQFKRLQDTLGLWHDYVVLSETALRTTIDRSLAIHKPAVHEQIMDLARHIWRQAHRHLTQFSSLWLKQREPVLSMIREALPGASDQLASPKGSEAAPNVETGETPTVLAPT